MQHCRTACVSVRRCNQVLIGAKHFSTTQVANEKHSCRVLVVGGGAGGCSLAAKFVTKVGKDQLIVIEPSDMHYYQPMFTLIGGGKKKLSQAGKHMGEVLPRNARWLKDSVAQFEPEQNRVVTTKGVTVEYDFMVVGAGIKLNYDQVPGLVEGLKMPKSGVCSNYSPDYVNLTHEALQRFDGGNAIFTFPNTPVKCAGAPQKIAYLSEEFLTKAGKRNKANIVYNTSLPVIFGVRKYADALSNVCERKNIKVNTQMELVEVKPEKKKAVFRDGKGSKHETEYELLHVTPPQGPVNALKNCKSLTDAAGFLDICPKTLRHSRFPNVYGVGDCTNAPTSKTGAAVAGFVGPKPDPGALLQLRLLLTDSTRQSSPSVPSPASSTAFSERSLIFARLRLSTSVMNAMKAFSPTTFMAALRASAARSGSLRILSKPVVHALSIFLFSMAGVHWVKHQARNQAVTSGVLVVEGCQHISVDRLDRSSEINCVGGIPERQNHVLLLLSKLLEAGWHTDPGVRLEALLKATSEKSQTLPHHCYHHNIQVLRNYLLESVTRSP